MKWHKVSKAHPCPICKKPDWCGVNDDGTMRICMRAPNGHPSKNGGYLYVWENGRWDEPAQRAFLGVPPFRTGKVSPPPPLPPKTAPKWAHKRLSTKEVTDFILGDMQVHLRWDFGVKDICGEDSDFECGTACAFGMYESKSHPHCVAIPMRNAAGDPVGIRFRHTLTKAKTSLKNGSDGLFFAPILFKRKVDTLIIVEGATDAIALAAVGFDVVGRSSCATGTNAIRELLSIVKPRNLVYVADNDHAKEIAGRMREAGREGAQKLAKEIKHPYKMISPLNAKDIREYILNMRAKGAETGQIRDAIARMIKDSRIKL